MVITSAHAIIYAEDAERVRAFLRDVLGLPHGDAGDGWLIFALPPTELGVHPADPAASGRHELYLMCDEIETTVEELTAKGVEFTTPVSEAGFGLVTSLRVPGGGEIGLYEPRHATAIGWLLTRETPSRLDRTPQLHHTQLERFVRSTSATC